MKGMMMKAESASTVYRGKQDMQRKTSMRVKSSYGARSQMNRQRIDDKRKARVKSAGR